MDLKHTLTHRHVYENGEVVEFTAKHGVAGTWNYEFRKRPSLKNPTQRGATGDIQWCIDTLADDYNLNK